MLKLKLQYFGHLMGRADSLEKTLMLGKIEGRRRKGRQRIRWLDSIIHPTDMSLSKLWEMVKDKEAYKPWGHKDSDMTERLSNNNAAVLYTVLCTKVHKHNHLWMMSVRATVHQTH